MKNMDFLQIAIFFIALLLLAIPLGRYMTKVYEKEKTCPDKILLPLEKLIYRLAGIDANCKMNWREYLAAVLCFNLIGILVLFLILLLQGVLPLNPQGFAGLKWDLALNTAVSFVTNTNWQAYSGESTMSYLSQMTGLTVQNFLSAATGMVVVIALIRGLRRREGNTIGNFWVDLVRTILWILLPLSIVGAVLLASQGVIQNFSHYLTYTTINGGQQTLAMGPVASQEAIKMLGTNGGGFMNANSAHPFENPTPFSNLLEMLFIFLIPVGLTLTFGRMTGNIKQGKVILAAMLILFALGLSVCYGAEDSGNPLLQSAGTSNSLSMEGKDVRFGLVNDTLFTTITTAASCGAVNNMHDSLTPMGGFIPMLQIMLGEVVFGGVGSGLYGMLVFVILTVFIVGLMVGRTPEYLGKKIESREIKMATLAVLVPAATILLFSATAAVTPAGTSSIANPGPHGLSEILYAFASGAGNNGSAFAGLNANTLFFNLGMALAMLTGRFGVIIPVLAIAGSMAAKKTVAANAGTFETTGPLFAGLLVGVVLIIGALTFFPALALGPIVEHFLMWGGKVF
ncbi:MAG: K+-transporting ATPase, KdpA [Firmicutes bacterium]|nr:K+-transporting ATPase, KdpA [Bacillota bacterium]